MEITAVTPLVMSTAWRDLLFVKVETDEGITGVGEVRPLNRTETLLAYLKEITPRYVLGEDPFNIEKLFHRMVREDFGRAGEIVMTDAALIEIVL